MRQKLTGFTLIELLMVLAIITILAAISIPNVTRYVMKSRDAKRISDIQVINLAIESFYDDRGHYPGWDDDNNLSHTGECIGVVGRPVPTTGFCNQTGATDGALDFLLREYIQGPIPHDPVYDNRGTEFFYAYDPFHFYDMPESVDWTTQPPTCNGHIYPNAGQDPDNTTAILGIRRFETNSVERHRDTCAGGALGDLELMNADYNIGYPEIGAGSNATLGR